MKLLTRVSVTSLLFFILVACNPQGMGGSPTGSIPTEEQIDTSESGGGNCGNPLFPVVYGAVWEYQAENAVIGDYTFSHEISTVGTDEFTLTAQFSTGVTADVEWTCDDGNLIQMQAGNGPAGMLSSLGGTYGFTETTSHTGNTLPATVYAGDTWEQSMILGGEVHVPPDKIGFADGMYTASFNAIGLEAVEVPAGAFQAMRIEVQAMYDLVITVDGIEVAVPIPTSMILWYAPNVGLVRAENNNEMVEYDIIELWRYTIP